MSENYMSCTDYISLDNCKDKFLYKLYSRNLGFGVFNKEKNGFIGIRFKIRYRYLFTEYHWDTGEPYGTVKPIEELQKVNLELNEKNTELFNFLDEFQKLNPNWDAFGIINVDK